MAVSSSQRVRMPRAPSQSISLGTSSNAAGASGLEKMPTVLMSGIQEKLLIPFRAQNRALYNVRSVVHPAHGVLNTLAGRPVQLRVARGSAPSDLPFAHFKLWLDEYNHFAPGL